MTTSIAALQRRDETTLRLGGDGDNFHMSWTADDRQLVAVCDGAGWAHPLVGVYNSRLFTVSGNPQEAHFDDVPGFPRLMLGPSNDAPKYYNFGTLAADGQIYQYLSTFNRTRAPITSEEADLRFVGTKLIYSPDGGKTWHNQDGSAPVVWEGWLAQSHESLVFLNESDGAFSLLSVLQMGQDYAQNKDGYVYVYAPNGNTEGTMNELVMYRVEKTRLLDRSAYEFFAGLRSDGQPSWTSDIEARGVVHTFPAGWVNTRVHPYAWHPSLAYNLPLDRYMMVNWGMGCSTDGDWFAKPSYLGFWVASKPWGPWEQVHEETAWMPEQDPAARAYQPQIAPRWIAEDGRSFWLVWTDFQHTEEFWPLVREAFEASTDEREFARLLGKARKYRPYYAFNTQRVDVSVG